ncbi:hypothetical protein PsYK624_108290 [Phanerochaete sordida]|uniref:Secreted protein n=1 Tax=Phanerochaete sordida TaxID=48140 RepID=A0A9P3GGT7_9APHY|nr:hypothetical protein PsYK624_108290 [Phanerochaete sordida]
MPQRTARTAARVTRILVFMGSTTCADDPARPTCTSCSAAAYAPGGDRWTCVPAPPGTDGDWLVSRLPFVNVHLLPAYWQTIHTPGE